MKKLLILCLILALSSFAYGAEQVKLGYVDLQKALNESEKGKTTKTDLEMIIKQKRMIIDGKINSRDKMKADIESQSSVLSPEAKKEKEKALEELETEIKTVISGSNDEVQKLQRQKEMEIIKDIEGIIEKIGEDENFTMIVSADVILYADDAKVDLTDRVITVFDKKFVAGETGKDEKAEKMRPEKSKPAKKK